MIDLKVVSDILKKAIAPAIYDQFTSKALLYQIAKKNAGITQWVNDKFYFPVRVQRFGGVIALPDGKSLQHGDPKFTQGVASVKLITGSFEIGKKTLAVKDAGSVVPILTRLSQDLTKDLIVDVNRQLFGTGDAVIGTVSGATSSSTTVVIIPQGGEAGDITAEDVITPGQYITNGDGKGVVQVTAVNGNTVTVASAQTYADGATIKKLTDDGTPADELDGLGELFAKGPYLGIDPATYPAWKAYVDDNGGKDVALALADMHKAYTTANKLGGVKYIFVNRTLFNKYGSLLENQIRFTPKDVLGGGWVGLDYMGGQAKIVLDYYAPDKSVIMISPKFLTIGELQPLQFEPGTNGTLLRESGKMDYEVVESGLFNLATFVRGAHAILKNRTA